MVVATSELDGTLHSQTRFSVRSTAAPAVTHRILRAVHRGDYVELTLRELATRTRRKVFLSRFSYLWRDREGRPLDQLILRTDSSGDVVEISKFVDGGFGQSGICRVFPYFKQETRPQGMALTQSRLVIREAIDSPDLVSIRHLAPFHYVSSESIWGRTHNLVAFFQDGPGRTGVPVGYLMLASPSLLSKPRSSLLGWDTPEQRVANANRVVRIARVVVHPEYRGLGIGIELVRAAISYSRDYWNVQGLKPWLVETIAEMSRYHPVFEKAGMTLFGETTGSNDSIFVSKKKLRSGQGPGFYRASIYRIKRKPRSPKPYYWYPVHHKLEALLTEKLAVTDTQPSELPKTLRQPLAPFLRLEDISVSLAPVTNWAEPRIRLSEYGSLLDLSRKSSEDFESSVLRSRELQARLLADSRIDAAIDGLLNVRLRRLARTNLTRLRSRLGRVPPTVKVETSVAPPNHPNRPSSAKLDKWDSERLRTISSLEKLVATLERSLVRTKKEDKNRRTSSVRVEILRLIDSLRSGPSSERFDAVKSAFGVTERTVLPVLQHVDLDILPGKIVLIAGPSGSGKSTLLNVITGAISPSTGAMTGFSPSEDVGILDLDFDPSRRLIDLVGRNTTDAISILNSVGLTEAGLYLRRRDELSHGQRYRAAVALLVSSRKRIWVADEFCTFLDPITAAIVCKGVRNLVSRYGVTFIAATPDLEGLQALLRPDVVVRLEFGCVAEPRLIVCSWGGSVRLSAFLNGLLRVERSRGSRVPRRILRVLSTLGLIERSLAVDKPPIVRLTRAGESILRTADPSATLCRYLYQTDLLLHRAVNDQLFPGGHHPIRPGPLSLSRVRSRGAAWSVTGFRREVGFRADIADSILKFDSKQPIPISRATYPRG